MAETKKKKKKVRYRIWREDPVAYMIDFRGVRWNDSHRLPTQYPCRNPFGKDPYKMVDDVKRYFASCGFVPQGRFWHMSEIGKNVKKSKLITVSGMAASLGITRKQLLEYAAGKYDVPNDPDLALTFAEVARLSLTEIEAITEELLYTPETSSGAKFSLARSFKWTTATEDSEIAARAAMVKARNEELDIKRQALGSGEDEALEIRVVCKGEDD